MKMNTIIKTALVGFIAVNAANAVDADLKHMGAPALMKLAHQLRHHPVVTPLVAMAALNHVDAQPHAKFVTEYLQGLHTGDQLIEHVRDRSLVAIKAWIDNNLMNNATAAAHPFLDPAVAHGIINPGDPANFGAPGAAVAVQGVARPGGAAWAANTVPANLSRAAFETALDNAVAAVNVASIKAAEADLVGLSGVAVPHRKTYTVNEIIRLTRLALGAELATWTADLTVAGANPFLDAHVAAVGGGAGLPAGAIVYEDVAAMPGADSRPATLTEADFVAHLVYIARNISTE